MTPIDINPADLETVRRILREKVPDLEVRVFGSRVSWTARETSDLDLVLMTKEPLDVSRMAELKETFSESNLPFRVDILDWADTSENFQRVIANKCPVIWRKQNLCNEWPTMELGNCIVINDSTRSPEKTWTFINYLDTGNIKENEISKIQRLIVGKDKIPSRARRQVQLGDIVYSTVRPNQKHFGLLKEIPENFLVSTGFSVMRGKRNLADTNFIYWFLTQKHIVEQLQVIAEQSTSAYPSIRPSDIESLKLNLPPIPKQCAIANVLDTLDNKVRLNHRINQTLESIAQALFKSWFVDFDPVRAKMEGRWRQGESLPCLPAHLYDFFPDRLADSELGQIPNGWDVKKLNDVAVMIKGHSYRSTDLVDSNTALATLKSFNRGGGYRSEGFKSYAGPYKPEQVIKPSEVIVACTDITQKAEVIGRPIMVRPNPRYTRFIASLHTIIVRPSNKRISNEFMYLLCGTPAFINHTYSYTTGTTVLGLSKNAISSFQFVLPSNEITLTFGQIAKNIFSKVFCLEEETNTLTELRNTLLPKLISGELSVNDMKNLNTAF